LCTSCNFCKLGDKDYKLYADRADTIKLKCKLSKSNFKVLLAAVKSTALKDPGAFAKFLYSPAVLNFLPDSHPARIVEWATTNGVLELDTSKSGELARNILTFLDAVTGPLFSTHPTLVPTEATLDGFVTALELITVIYMTTLINQPHVHGPNCSHSHGHEHHGHSHDHGHAHEHGPDCNHGGHSACAEAEEHGHAHDENGQCIDNTNTKSTAEPMRSLPDPTQPVCVVCQKPASSLCANCKSVRYCGRECQKSHWPQHKKSCNKQ